MNLQVLMRDAAAAFGAGDMARAEPLFRHITAANPRDADAWHALAVITCRSGRASEAIECAMQAHKLNRRNHFYLNTLGVASFESGQAEESLRWFRRALKEKPNHAEAHYNLGKALTKLDQYDAAERAYRSALRIDPNYADAATNLAGLCIRTSRYDEALALLDLARALHPDSETVAINTSQALLAKAGSAAAIDHLTQYVERNPGSARVHFHLALRLLASARFVEGWREYAWRLRVPGATTLPGVAQELPSDLSATTVVLLPAQGLGDQLFFLRFASLLRQRASKVLYACPAKLLPVLENTLGLDGVFSPELAPPPPLQNAITASVGELPRLVGAAATPPPFPLVVPAQRIADWRERLAALGPPPYLGVTWRGGTKRDTESEFAPSGLPPLFKEIDIGLFAKAVSDWPGTVVVLQRLPSAAELAEFSKAFGRKVHDLSPLNEQLGDMSAVLALIDEYVGVSNTNMHIRAGLGKTARVLVPFPAEFRWMDAGDTSPWFPGFRLYRLPPSRDWGEPLLKLKEDVSG